MLLIHVISSDDRDIDGYTSDIDCNDSDLGIFPGADVTDQNCDVLSEVGEKEPNSWGLYDVHGNVFEGSLTNCYRSAQRSYDLLMGFLGLSDLEINNETIQKK